MKHITVNMLGNPSVLYEDRKIVFKYRKAEAIFYFIALHRSVERSKVLGTFWPDEPEERARKNLRNALYSVRAAFDTEVIINVGQRILTFSEGVSVSTDCDFLNCPEVDHSHREFLEGFILKETPDFEDWANGIREEIRVKRLAYWHRQFEELGAAGKDPEHAGKEILRYDPYDETVCRSLMQYYIRVGQSAKCIDLYGKLCKTLEEDLSLTPEPETMDVFQGLMEIRQPPTGHLTRTNGYFYGRTVELERMETFAHVRRADEQSGFMLISGEAGIGKTVLIRHFLECYRLPDVFRISIACHEGDENHLLKTWYPVMLKFGEILTEHDVSLELHKKEILSKMFPGFMKTMVAGGRYPMETQDSVSLEAVIRMALDAFNAVLGLYPVLLTIEDIHWMDPWSLQLLEAFISESKSGRLLCVGSCRSGIGEGLDRFLNRLSKGDLLLPLRLNRFNKAETEQFIRSYPGQPGFTVEVMASIYSESEGNPLILTEILKSLIEKGSFGDLPMKVRSIFLERYQSLSTDGRKLADVMAVFSESVGWETLRAFNTLPDLELLEVLEELIKAEFLYEVDGVDDGLRTQYTHQKLKTFVYDLQSTSKKRILHKRIGDYYRGLLQGIPEDRKIYPLLIHHYERSGERSLVLAYRIRSLYDYMEITHELFPKLSDRTVYLQSDEKKVTDDFLFREIKAIEKLMDHLPDSGLTGSVELEYLNMAGRYHIVSGDVSKGCQLTLRMIQLADKENRFNFVLKGYLQLIFNAINQRNVFEMETLIRQAFQQVKKGTNKGELGVLIRLKGYLMILQNRFEQGEALLKSAARIFEREEYRESYALNRVAAMYYIGESRRLQNDSPGAIHWYEAAETLCRNMGFSSHLPLMLAGIGITAYDSGDYTMAEKALSQSVENYDLLPFKWGQIQAYGYWALICIRNNELRSCLKYLKKADELTASLGHVLETGLMYRVKAEICSLIRGTDGNRELKKYLKLQDVSYCREAVRFFGVHPSFTYEEKLLSEVRKICGGCCAYP